MKLPHALRLAATVLSVVLTSALSLSAAIAPAASAPSASMQINVGSTGVDGVFNPQANVEIDLGVLGTYDPVHWRVVFNYVSVHIPAGVTVTFKNHPSRAPVVWLSQGDILIEGTVDLDGQAGVPAPNFVRSEPGPGGFRGGSGGPAGPGAWMHSGGLGPGGASVPYWHPGGTRGASGGHANNGNATYGPTPGGSPYGDPGITWLVGGSGGGGGCPSKSGAGVNSSGGGAGGGAILLGANTLVHVAAQGAIHANGGNTGGGIHFGGGGSGGGVRIVAQEVRLDTGASVHARGGSSGTAWGNGSDGRIRLEANVLQINTPSWPPASQGAVASILPPPGSGTVKVVQVGGLAVPVDPVAGLSTGSGVADLNLNTGADTVILIRTTNVPLNAEVYLHVTMDNGTHSTLQVTDGTTNSLAVTGGAQLEAEVSFTLNLAEKHSALQVRVVLP